jgi:hypothetical protein
VFGAIKHRAILRVAGVQIGQIAAPDAPGRNQVLVSNHSCSHHASARPGEISRSPRSTSSSRATPRHAVRRSVARPRRDGHAQFIVAPDATAVRWRWMPVMTI